MAGSLAVGEHRLHSPVGGDHGVGRVYRAVAGLPYGAGVRGPHIRAQSRREPLRERCLTRSRLLSGAASEQRYRQSRDEASVAQCALGRFLRSCFSVRPPRTPVGGHVYSHDLYTGHIRRQRRGLGRHGTIVRSEVHQRCRVGQPGYRCRWFHWQRFAPVGPEQYPLWTVFGFGPREQVGA